LKLSEDMLRADNKNLYPMDFFCLWIVHRSLFIISWFYDLIKNKNFICALSLIRLHLDSLLQLYWAYIVNNPHDFVNKIMIWKETREINDKDWNKMTDWYLRKVFFRDKNNNEFIWLEKVYEETSWFIHFSNKHIYSTLKSQKWNKFELLLSDEMDAPLNKNMKLSIVCWW
jgi:hypothetical protein